MNRFLLSFLLVLGATGSFAQLNNHAFEDRRQIDEADSGKLFLGVNVLGWSKDNEYDLDKNPVITGYTLFGYQLNPYLSYHITKNIRIDGGIYLQKDFGNPKYTTIAPTLSVKYERKSFSLIFGNLEGSLNHRLIEPLYDFERVLNNRLENGLQAKVMKDGLFLDVWIDWTRMIYVNDAGQEYLTAGLNLNKRIATIGKTQISLPIQTVARHHGGQINYQFSGGVETIFNSALGLEIKRPSSGFIRESRLSGFYVYYKSLSNNLFQPFRSGNGAYFNGSLSTRFGLEVMGSYWKGDGFITAEGGKIYPSVSVLNGAVNRPMELFILRLMYDLKIQDGLYASARLEPFYDFHYHSIQTAFGVYLNFRERFFLGKPKKQ